MANPFPNHRRQGAHPHEQGDDLETAQKHPGAPDQQRRGAAFRTEEARAHAGAAEARDEVEHRLLQGGPAEDERERTGRAQQQVQHHVGLGLGHVHLGEHRALPEAVDLDARHVALVTVALVQIVAEPQRGDGDAVELDAAGGGARLGPDEHEQAEQEQERRPQIGKGGDGLKPRGGQDRHDLERALPQRLGSVAADALA